MAVYDNAALQNITIDQKWDRDVLEGRYATGVIMQRVLNKSALVKDSGYNIVIPIEPVYAAGTVTSATGAFTPVNTAPTNANILINVWQYHSVEITDQAQLQSFWDPTKSTFGKIAGKVMGVAVEDNLAALFNSLTGLGTVGTDPSAPDPFGQEQAAAALLLAENAYIPRDSMSFILSPSAFYAGMFQKPELTAAYATGLPKTVHTTGYRMPLFGVPTYSSARLANAGQANQSKVGALIHKEALAIAFQADNKYEVASRVPNLFLSTVAVAQSAYGSAVIRSDHGVRIFIKA